MPGDTFLTLGENAVWVRKGLWLARETVRYSTGNPGRVTGYAVDLGRVTGHAVALTGDTARAGDRCGSAAGSSRGT